MHHQLKTQETVSFSNFRISGHLHNLSDYFVHAASSHQLVSQIICIFHLSSPVRPTFRTSFIYIITSLHSSPKFPSVVYLHCLPPCLLSASKKPRWNTRSMEPRYRSKPQTFWTQIIQQIPAEHTPRYAKIQIWMDFPSKNRVGIFRLRAPGYVFLGYVGSFVEWCRAKPSGRCFQTDPWKKF